MRGLKYTARLFATGLATVLAGAVLTLPALSIATAGEKPPQEWDGLERRTNKKLDNVYVRPDVVFKAYQRVKLAEPVDVRFDENWDPNSGTRELSRRLTTEDIEKIRTELAALFREEFSKRLEKGGYPVVDTAGDDVLQVEAALVNLYINAPEKMSAGRSRSYTMDAGRVTLVMQLSDSVSHQILARVVDTQQGMDTGQLTWTTSVSNSAEASRIVRLWADQLVKGLDKVNGRSD